MVADPEGSSGYVDGEIVNFYAVKLSDRDFDGLALVFGQSSEDFVLDSAQVDE